MKIKRQALIEIIQRRLCEVEDDREKRYVQAVKDWQTAENKYVEQTANAWLDFSRVIQDKVGRGELLTRDDIPATIKISSSWNGLEFFDKKKPLPPTPHEVETHLRRLVELLKNSTDIEVSTHALEKAGFPIGRVLK